jgi:hypothetical protein
MSHVGPYRIGPPAEKDWTKWETELAYLIVAS